jgi:hypothetical protein
LRDVVAGLAAAILVFVALSLLTTLHVYLRRHQRARQVEVERGRTIVVELPTDPELTLFTEDATHFYYGAQPIDKRAVSAVRVLINGSPIAAAVSPRLKPPDARAPTSFEDRPEGIARDRWDVAIETLGDTVLVECGAVRERVSQELARKIFEAVRRAIA